MIKTILGLLYLANMACGRRASQTQEPLATAIEPSQPHRPPASRDDDLSGSVSSPTIPFVGFYHEFCPRLEPSFLNDHCDDHHLCYDNSLECKDNKCSCKRNMIPSRDHNGLCELAPYLNQPCNSVCQVPFVCKDPWPEGDANNTSWPRRPPTCSCELPYYVHNQTNDCRLDCKADEWYDKNDGKCKPRCKTDEVKLDDGSCAKVAKIGQHCKYDEQCTQAYAKCAKGICRCDSGFDEGGGQCNPKKYSCPWRDPLRDSGGNVIQCNKTNPFSHPSYQLKDACPNGGYCQAIESYYSPNSVITGICCPTPIISCPVGDPIPDTTCTTSSFHPLPETDTPRKPCPLTHYCYAVEVQNRYTESLCCRKPCRDTYVLIEGVCYPMLLQNGDACKFDDQCKGLIGGICSNGTCKCPPNSVAQSADERNPDYIYCFVQCGADEVLINNKCYKRLNLGDSCENSSEELCPANAGCDENKTCSCFCGYIPLDNKRCGPYPVCRRNDNYPPSPDARRSGHTAPPGLNQTTTVCLETDRSDDGSTAGKSKPNGNYTFCRLYDSDTPPVPTVAKCPNGQFCNFYEEDFGLCCPIPDPICPNGLKSEKTCQPEESDTCGSGQFCYEYFQADGGSSPHAGYACCPGPRF